MHAVVRDVVDRDGLERVEADDELDGMDRGARRADARQQLGRQVQPGGRRGRRAGPGGVDRLVPLGSVEARGDVRRQRHLTHVVEQLEGVGAADVDEVDVERVAGACAGADDQHGAAVRAVQLLALAQLAGGAHEGLPVAAAGILRFEQQHLGLAARRPSEPQAGRDDPRLVDDDDVPAAEEIGQVGNGAVLRRGRTAVDEQARRVARFDRHLGDRFRRQRVVELVETHGSTLRICQHQRP